MKRSKADSSQLPLVELADGRDQDNRSDLYLAFKKCADWRKVTNTNLHVRELLMYVCACDRDGRGVQKSYGEIANRLELKDDQAARYVISRAAKDFRLLLVTEARYERGGQSANRYSINWPLVRAIRDGLEDGRPYHTPQEPGVTESHPGVTESQAGVTESHPYKEYSRTNTRTISLHPITTPPPNLTSGTRHQEEEEGSGFEKPFSEATPGQMLRCPAGDPLALAGESQPAGQMLRYPQPPTALAVGEPRAPGQMLRYPASDRLALASPSQATGQMLRYPTPSRPALAGGDHPRTRQMLRYATQEAGERSPAAPTAAIAHGPSCASSAAHQQRRQRLIARLLAVPVYSAADLLGSLPPSIDLDYVERVMDYYDSHSELGPGALVVRLRRSQPDLAPDAAWPPAPRLRASQRPSVPFVAGDPYA